MKSLHILLVSLLGQTPALAQTLYRCGSTFSQTPCAADAQKIEVKPATGLDCSDYNMFTDVCRSKAAPSPANDALAARAKVQKQIEAMPPFAPPAPEVIEANKKRCLARITAVLKDPETARVGEVSRANGPAPDYETARGWFPSIAYTVSVNAKNSYGGYTGSKTWLCSFDLSERELLRARSFE